MTDRFQRTVVVSFTSDEDSALLPLAQIERLARHVLRFHANELRSKETAVQFVIRALDERRGAKLLTLN